MVVDTYNDGHRRITMIGHKTMINNPDNWKYCMYRMTKRDDMLDDLIVTGGHSILVDHPPQLPEEIALQKKYWNKQYRLKDKYMLLASVSKQFTKIDDHQQYTYYHLVLEDESPDRHFGIWANGILTESQCRRHFVKHNYDCVDQLY